MESESFLEQGEFGFIEKLQKEVSNKGENSRIELGIGDDCAIVNYDKGKYVYTTDVLVEGVHYKLEWSSWSEIIHKACIASLSDVNAMGADPIHMMISLGLKKGWPETKQNEFIQTISEISKKYSVAIIGGDTVSAPVSFINIAMTGQLSGKAILRSNAAPGQSIYVSGSLGGSAAGLSLLENGIVDKAFDAIRVTHTNPDHPFGLGSLLASSNEGVGGMDISDGLSSELMHISHKSGVKLKIFGENVPKHPLLKKYSDQYSENFEKLWFNSGEEYELLFTINDSNSILSRVERDFAITKIGEVLPGSGVEMVDSDGNSHMINPESYTHF